MGSVKRKTHPCGMFLGGAAGGGGNHWHRAQDAIGVVGQVRHFQENLIKRAVEKKKEEEDRNWVCRTTKLGGFPVGFP